MYIFLSWFLTTLLWDYLPCRCSQSPHSQPLTLLAFVTCNTKSGRKSLVQFHTWWKHINIIATITNFMMQLHNHMITTLHFSLLEYSPELWLQYGSNSTDNQEVPDVSNFCCEEFITRLSSICKQVTCEYTYVNISFVPTLSPIWVKEPGTFYHVHDVKGGHYLITQEWTIAAPTHVQV